MIYAILQWLHILSVVMWIGGMFYTLFVLKPNLKIIENKKAEFMENIMNKFFPFVWISIILLLFTGGVKAKHYINSIFFDLKLFVYFLMVFVFSYIYFGLYKRLHKSENKGIILNKISNLIKLNFSLGLLIIFLIELTRYLG